MKKSTLKILTMLFSIMLTIGLLAACGTTNENGTDKPETNKNNSDTSVDKTYGLNEEADLKTLKITALSVEKSEGSDYNKPAEGKMFVGVKFLVENISDKDQNISSLLLFEPYIDGTKGSLSFTSAMEFTEGTIDGTLAPGKNMEGYYPLEVSKDAKNLEFQVKSEWLSSNKDKAIFNLEIPGE